MADDWDEGAAAGRAGLDSYIPQSSRAQDGYLWAVQTRNDEIRDEQQRKDAIKAWNDRLAEEAAKSEAEYREKARKNWESAFTYHSPQHGRATQSHPSTGGTYSPSGNLIGFIIGIVVIICAIQSLPSLPSSSVSPVGSSANSRHEPVARREDSPPQKQEPKTLRKKEAKKRSSSSGSFASNPPESDVVPKGIGWHCTHDAANAEISICARSEAECLGVSVGYSPCAFQSSAVCLTYRKSSGEITWRCNDRAEGCKDLRGHLLGREDAADVSACRSTP